VARIVRAAFEPFADVGAAGATYPTAAPPAERTAPISTPWGYPAWDCGRIRSSTRASPGIPTSTHERIVPEGVKTGATVIAAGVW